MKASKDLLRRMTKFVNYEPKLPLRFRILFLHLDMKRQEIEDVGGSKTAADIVYQIMDKTPKEFMTVTLITKKEIQNAINKGKTDEEYLKLAKSTLQSEWKDEYSTAKP